MCVYILLHVMYILYSYLIYFYYIYNSEIHNSHPLNLVMALLRVIVIHVYRWDNIQQPPPPGIYSLAAWQLLLFDFDVLAVLYSNRAFHALQLPARPAPLLSLIPRSPQ